MLEIVKNGKSSAHILKVQYLIGVSIKKKVQEYFWKNKSKSLSGAAARTGKKKLKEKKKNIKTLKNRDFIIMKQNRKQAIEYCK